MFFSLTSSYASFHLATFTHRNEAIVNTQVSHHCSRSSSQAYPAPPRIRDVFSKIGREAEARKLSLWSWLVVLTATTITMNSPESMTALFQHSSASKPLTEGVAIAEFMREVGLRCMGINGV